MTEYRLCLVRWRDIIETTGWDKDVSCPEIYSIGWHVYEDSDTLKIANTLDYEDFSGENREEEKPVPYGLTAFPKGCVMKVTYISSTALREGSLPSPQGASLHSTHNPDSATAGNV